MLEAESERHLGKDGHHDDDDGDGGVAGRAGMHDLHHRFLQRHQASGKDDDGDDHRSQVLHAPIAEGMPRVGTPASQLRAHDGDHRGQRVGGVVHAVEHDGDGMRCEAHHQLEGYEHHVAHDADGTALDYLTLAIHGSARLLPAPSACVTLAFDCRTQHGQHGRRSAAVSRTMETSATACQTRGMANMPAPTRDLLALCAAAFSPLDKCV